MQTEREQKMNALVDELVTMTARVAAGEYQWLKLVREVEDIIILSGGESYPRYLAWQCGMSLKTSYERVRVARALASLPCIAKLFEEGRITYSKVRIVTRVATPETDAKYADLALNGPVHFLEKLVRVHTKIEDDEAPRIEERRFVSFSTDDDGMVVMHARLAPDEGAIVKKAIEAAQKAGAGSACDALTEVAKAGVEKIATGDDAILHVENTPHICAVEGHACCRATADRLICENPNRRRASETQVRILKQLQGGCCAFPGCPNTRFTHAHHIVHWSKGGKTRVENLALMCTKHHRDLHEGGYSLTRENKQLVFRNPHGLLIDPAPKLPGIPQADRDLASFPTPSVRDLDAGEFYTNRDNLECSIEWLLQPTSSP